MANKTLYGAIGKHDTPTSYFRLHIGRGAKEIGSLFEDPASATDRRLRTRPIGITLEFTDQPEPGRIYEREIHLSVEEVFEKVNSIRWNIVLKEGPRFMAIPIQWSPLFALADFLLGSQTEL